MAFATDTLYLAPSYLRMVTWEGYHYGFCGGMERHLYRSRERREVFEQGIPLEIDGEAFTDPAIVDKNEPGAVVYRTRHVAFHRRGHELEIYYSNSRGSPSASRQRRWTSGRTGRCGGDRLSRRCCGRRRITRG